MIPQWFYKAVAAVLALVLLGMLAYTFVLPGIRAENYILLCQKVKACPLPDDLERAYTAQFTTPAGRGVPPPTPAPPPVSEKGK